MSLKIVFILANSVDPDKMAVEIFITTNCVDPDEMLHFAKCSISSGSSLYAYVAVYVFAVYIKSLVLLKCCSYTIAYQQRISAKYICVSIAKNPG